MDDQAIDDALLTLAFSVKSNPGAYALLIGAGVSAASVKTAWGVLEDLTGQVAELVTGHPVPDPIDWYRSTYKAEARYETLLEKIAPTPTERQKLLRGYFEPSPDEVRAGSKTPTAAHHSVARLAASGAVRVIITLNFDRLIEQALRAAGVEPTVIASAADVAGMAPLHTIGCCVLHLHGDYLSATTMRNTLTELESYHPATSALLEQVLRDYGLIIAGWSSVYDPMLRSAIAEYYSPRFTLAWIEPREVSQPAAELRALKNGLLIPATADAALGMLADAVDALRARHAAHPLTVPVAVQTAKRQLSGLPVAIDLHDTLNHEFGRLHGLADFHLPDLQDDVAYGGYEAILGRVEEASRLACALVATLAYWGNPSTDRWWVDEIGRFARRVRGGGLTRLINVRLVTGSALFYAAGVSAVAGQRFDLLARLFTSSDVGPNGVDRETLATLLDPGRVYELQRPSLRGHGVVAPVLGEALAISDDALDEAWQRFEVLRLAVNSIASSSFRERHLALVAAENVLHNAQGAFDKAERAQDGVDEARSDRADAVRERQRRLGQLSDLVPYSDPHLLTMDDYSSHSHRVPVAERFADDVAAEGDSHPVVAAGVAPTASDLAVALRAVSAAVGRRGRDLAFGNLHGQGGAVADAVWIDSGTAP